MLFAPALTDLEIPNADRFRPTYLNFRYVCRAGRRRPKLVNEALQRAFRTLEKYFDALVVVRNPASERICVGEPEHEGPETDSLDDTSNFNRECVHV
jgi:hypothetical protein